MKPAPTPPVTPIAAPAATVPPVVTPPPAATTTMPAPTAPVGTPTDPATFGEGGQTGKYDLVSIGFLVLGVAYLAVSIWSSVKRAKESKKLAMAMAEQQTHIQTIENVLATNKLMAA